MNGALYYQSHQNLGGLLTMHHFLRLELEVSSRGLGAEFIFQMRFSSCASQWCGSNHFEQLNLYAIDTQYYVNTTSVMSPYIVVHIIPSLWGYLHIHCPRKHLISTMFCLTVLLGCMGWFVFKHNPTNFFMF